MNNTEELENAKAVANDFFREMSEWENWCAGFDINQPSEETREVRLSKLVEIFNKYLSSKALKRKQARYETLSFQKPSAFGRGILSVEHAEAGKVWIYIPIGPLNGRARYLMEKEGDSWKVDLTERDIANVGKWERYLFL